MRTRKQSKSTEPTASHIVPIYRSPTHSTSLARRITSKKIMNSKIIKPKVLPDF